MATLLRSEYDVIRTRQSLDDFRRLLSLLAEDEVILIAEDELNEDAEDIEAEGFVVGPEFGTTATRSSGEEPQVQAEESVEEHLVSVESQSETTPFAEAERVAAEQAEIDAAAAESGLEPAEDDGAVPADSTVEPLDPEVENDETADGADES